MSYFPRVFALENLCSFVKFADSFSGFSFQCQSGSDFQLLETEFRFTVLFRCADEIRRAANNFLRDMRRQVEQIFRAVFVRDEFQNHFFDPRIAAEQPV